MWYPAKHIIRHFWFGYIYLLFVDNDINDLIVEETNQYAQQILDKTAVSGSSRKKKTMGTPMGYLKIT